MRHQICGTEPILCAPLIRQVDAQLVELLRALTPEEWNLQTLAPAWRVRDVAAHLLDTPLRKLSVVRDRCFVEKPQLQSPQDLVDFINRLNREGVAVYRRLSPTILIELMELACRGSADFHESLDPFAPALFNVSWAGEAASPNWFDTARELTERWHHQQQIRHATDRPGIMTPALYHPVLDCFLRGVPHAYRNLDASPGTAVQIDIDGDCGGTWLLTRIETGWTFNAIIKTQPAARALIPQEIAWRIFTKGIARAEAIEQCVLEGDRQLCEKVFHFTAIVG